MRKTKIICTIGPSSKDENKLVRMIEAGMNVARINFSHGSKEEHIQTIRKLKDIRKNMDVPLAILVDTRGPEIRIKNFKEGRVELSDGDEFTLTTRDIEGDKSIVSITYDRLTDEVKAGDRILIDDGKIILSVLDIEDDNILCNVIHGGELSNHKGVNLPSVDLSLEYLNEKDKEDILSAIEEDIDYIAASFVRTEEDVKLLRDFLNINGGESVSIISKIESTQGVENFDEILKASDGIMIARGDMGVEVSYEKLPGLQKRFIKRCVRQGKPVITATQMLESMIHSPVPTRAEITDVANAVFDGTSAVMLSAESAAGEFPVEAVATMSKIALQAEEDMKSLAFSNRSLRQEIINSSDVTNAIAHGACTLAEDIRAGAIMAVTKTGYTAAGMSKFRTAITVIGATPYEKTYNKMSLMWGVLPLMADYGDTTDKLVSHFIEKAISKGIINIGDSVVITAGLPVDVKGNTNLIKVIMAEI